MITGTQIGMCTNEVTIKNPNFGKKPIGVFALKDCTHSKIRVPCGHCPECVANKQMSMAQRVQMQALNADVFFCSITYKNSMLPRIEVNGYSIPYADTRDVTLMIKRIRKDDLFGVPFTYFAVSERGNNGGRPHFHILFFVQGRRSYNDVLNLERHMYKIVFEQWKRKIGGSRKHPIYEPCFEYHERWRKGKLEKNFDLHYIQPYLGDLTTSSVAFYCMKYMLKTSEKEVKLQQALHMNLTETEYERIWKKVKSRYFKSLDFGLSKDINVTSRLRDGVRRSREIGNPFPMYYNPDTGDTFPLSRFYKGKGNIYTLEDALAFKSNSGETRADTSSYTEEKLRKEVIDKYRSKMKRQWAKFEKIQEASKQRFEPFE